MLYYQKTFIEMAP